MNDEAMIALVDRQLRGIPPGSLPLDGTPDQVERWKAVKARYSALRKNLVAYFSKQEVELNGLDATTAEYFMLERDRWIAFYTLIQYSWSSIRTLAEKHGISLEDSGIATIEDALVAAIKQSAEMHLHPAYAPYYRWTPSEKRKQIKLLQEANRIEALRKQGEEISKKDARKIADAHREWRKLDAEVSQYCVVERLCLAACWQSEHKDARVRDYLKKLEQAEQEIFHFLRSHLLHERKKVKGEEWRHGQKTLMDRYGGKPVKKTSQ